MESLVFRTRIAAPHGNIYYYVVGKIVINDISQINNIYTIFLRHVPFVPIKFTLIL